MVPRNLQVALSGLVSSIPELIALAAGIVVCAINLKRRPKAAAAGLIAFSGFLVLELVLPVLNYALIGFLLRLELSRAMTAVQGAVRILSPLISAGLWVALIYGLFYAEGKEAGKP